MAGKIIRNGIGGHAPRQGGIGAEGLHIEEIAPAPDGLSQHHTGEGRIGNGQHGQLFAAANDKRHDKRPDDAAVDGQPAAPQVKDLLEVVLIMIPLERHIVGARPHNGAEHRPQDYIQSLIGVNAAAAVVGKIDPQPQAEAHRDDNAVPVDLQTADGNRHPADGDLPSQTGEPQNLHGITSFVTLVSFTRLLYHSRSRFVILIYKFLCHSGILYAIMCLLSLPKPSKERPA